MSLLINGVPYEHIEDMASIARIQRDSLFRETEWILERAREQELLGVLPVYTVQQVLNYRQNLRDVPSQESFPDNIQWPVIGNQ